MLTVEHRIPSWKRVIVTVLELGLWVSESEPNWRLWQVNMKLPRLIKITCQSAMVESGQLLYMLGSMLRNLGDFTASKARKARGTNTCAVYCLLTVW